MARIIGGIAASHTPTIGFAYDRNKRDDPVWAPNSLFWKFGRSTCTRIQHAGRLCVRPALPPAPR